MTRETAIEILSNRDGFGIPTGYTSGYAETIKMSRYIDANKIMEVMQKCGYPYINLHREHGSEYECVGEYEKGGEIEQLKCPNCGGNVDRERMICPYCDTQFKKDEPDVLRIVAYTPGLEEHIIGRVWVLRPEYRF